MDEVYCKDDKASYLEWRIKQEEKKRQEKKIVKKRGPYKAKTIGKYYFIWFQESKRWVQGTELGFNNAIRDGRPVARGFKTPIKNPVELFSWRFQKNEE